MKNKLKQISLDQAYDIIKRPITTEKSTNLQQFNQYSFIPINPSLHTHVKYQLVEKLENWLTSPTAKSMINGYEIDGEALFTFNAKPK